MVFIRITILSLFASPKANCLDCDFESISKRKQNKKKLSFRVTSLQTMVALRGSAVQSGNKFIFSKI